MEDWKTRLLFERNELMDRHDKLVAFLKSDLKDQVDPKQLEYMVLQEKAMDIYFVILNLRIFAL